jgi:tetratricopeptide (TPR) repeat protein
MIRIICDVATFTALAQDWNQLAAARANPLLSHEWFLSWAETLADHDNLHVIVIEQNNRLCAAAPLQQLRKGGATRLELLGTINLREPSGILYEDPVSLDQLVTALTSAGISTALRRIENGTTVKQVMAAHGRARLIHRPSGPTPYVPIAQNWDDYFASLSSRRRYDFRRSRNRLERIGEVKIDISCPPRSELDRLLEIAFDIEAAGWKGRRGSALRKNARLQTFMRRYAARACTSGNLRLGFLTVGGTPIAMQIALLYAQRYWVLKIGYDERYAKYSPGMQLTMETVRYAFTTGCNSYEFLGTCEPWIEVWTKQTRTYDSLAFYPYSSFEELGVTKAALTSFFKILEQKQVPLTELDSTLRDIAKRYKELQDKLTATSSDDEAITALKRQAKEALDRGEFDKAERLLNEASDTDVAAAKVMQANANNRLLSAAAAKAEAGDVKYTQLAYREAAAYYQKAAQLVPPGEDAVLAGYLNEQGIMLHSAGQYSEAQPPLERALAIWEKALGPEHPHVATSLNNLAELYHTQGQYAKAVPLYQRSLAIWEKALGPEHPHVATSLNNLAELYHTQEQYAKAIPLYQRSLAIWEKALGPEHPDVAASLNNLAGLYYAQGQYAKAAPLYQRSLAILEKTLGPEHPDVAASLENYVALLRELDRTAEAEMMEVRAKAIRAAH